MKLTQRGHHNEPVILEIYEDGIDARYLLERVSVRDRERKLTVRQLRDEIVRHLRQRFKVRACK